MRFSHQLKTISLALMLSIILGACGQKGPLFLPEKKPISTPQQTPQAPKAPKAATQSAEIKSPN